MDCNNLQHCANRHTPEGQEAALLCRPTGEENQCEFMCFQSYYHSWHHSIRSTPDIWLRFILHLFPTHTHTLLQHSCSMCRAFCTCTRGRKLSLFVESLEECSNRPGKESPTTNFARLTTVFLSFGSILFLGILFLFVILCASHQLGLSYVSLGKPIGFAEVAAAAARYRLLMWRERLILCCQRGQSEQSERKREIVENEQSCTANTAFPAARDYVSGGNVMLWQQPPWWEYLVTFRSSAGVAREE